jgi:heme A synthase
LGAFLVSVHVLLLWKRTSALGAERWEIFQPAKILMLLLGIQLGLGGLSWYRGYPSITTAHLGVGALMLAATVVLTMQAHRRLEPA